MVAVEEKDFLYYIALNLTIKLVEKEAEQLEELSKGDGSLALAGSMSKSQPAATGPPPRSRA